MESARREKSDQPAPSAIRCLILYPMNALVADQLGRIRHMLGTNKISGQLKQEGLEETQDLECIQVEHHTMDGTPNKKRVMG